MSAFTGDLIPPEAVMKLRQKHPGTVRVAETDEGNVVQDSPLLVKMSTASQTPPMANVKKSISSHLPSLCKACHLGQHLNFAGFLPSSATLGQCW